MNSITKKIVFSLILLCIIFLGLTVFTYISVEKTISESGYNKAIEEVEIAVTEQIHKKLDIGITNAVGFSANEVIQQALRSDDRALAIETLSKISSMYKSNTNFKGIKVHLHNKQGLSFVRSWKTDKYGENLADFRPLVREVIEQKKAFTGLELGNVGLMIRAIAPIIDHNNVYLGSVEFLQGVGSISRDFEKQDSIYILLAKEELARKSTTISNSRKFANLYSVNDSWFSDKVVNEIGNLNIGQLLKDKRLLTDKFLFTYVPAKLFDGTVVGYHIIGIPKAAVEVTINQTLDTAKLLIGAFGIFFIIVIILLVYFLRSVIIKPIRHITSNIAVITNGDFTQKIHCLSNDELGALTRNVEKMRISLHDVINVVQQNSSQMAHSAQQVSAVSSDISSTSILEQQSSTQVTDAINSLLKTSDIVSENIDSTALASRKTLEMAEQGITIVNESIEELNCAVNSVNQTAEQMKELKSSTIQINDITETIHAIAEQTNLLALNAAIEAARAGEQGRGFAVVADEVRNLAARTSSSSAEISNLISTLIDKVENSVSSMQGVVDAVYHSQEKSAQTVNSFTSMSEGISKTTENTDVIASYSREQTENLQYLDSRLKDLFEVLSASSNKARTTSMVASDLYQISEKLDNHLQGFVTEVSESIIAQSNEQRRAPRAENKLRVNLQQGNIDSVGLTQDISLEGIKVRSTSVFNKDKDISVELQIPKELSANLGDNLLLNAKVVHIEPTEDYFTYGISFTNVNTDGSNKLKALFRYFKQPYQFE